MDDSRYEAIEAKRERNAYFRNLRIAGAESQRKPKPSKVKPKKEKKKEKEWHTDQNHYLSKGAEWPHPCKSCDRKMFRKGYPKPGEGWVSYGSNGICSTCSARERKGSNVRQKAPTHCKKCGREFHNKYAKNTVRKPGTVIHSGKGLCGGCYNAKQREDAREANASQGSYGVD